MTENRKRRVATPADDGQLRRRLGLQVIFLVIVAGLMWSARGCFDGSWFGGDEPRGRPVSREELAAEWREQLRERKSMHVEIDSPEEAELFSELLDEQIEAEGGEPLDLGTNRAENEPELAPFTPDPESSALAASKDRTAGDVDLGVVVDDAVLYQLHRALADPVAVLEGEPVLSTAAGDRVGELLVAQPDVFRGQLVEIVGNLVAEERGDLPIRLHGVREGHASHLDRAFRSYVYDSNEKYHLVFTGVPQVEFAHLDPVVFRGYFCRLYTNDVEVDGQIRKGTIPLLVGVEFRPKSYEPPSAPFVFYLVPIVLILPVIAGVVIFVLSRRTERTYDARREAARKTARQPES